MTSEIVPADPESAVTVVPADPAGTLDTFEASLAAEQEAERTMGRAIARGIVMGLPIGIVFFVTMMAIAISDKAKWQVWIGLGILMGVIAAGLFGMLGGVTLTAHKLDDVDRRVHH
jgi:threonine/homoserine/homoserine lactone efflux protein